MQHKSYIGIKNESSEVLELHFTDFIYDGFDWETWEEINMVQDTIDKIKAANPSKIKMVINSLGGDVMIGLALYNYLKNHPASVEVEVIGFAASIASIMAMAADPGKLRMAKNAFMIIHAAWSYAGGNAKQLREQAENLDKVTNELADVYAQRSGKEASYFTSLWADGDYWITGKEAMEMGLADELFNSEVKAHANIKDFGFKNIPAQLLNSATEPENDTKNFFQSLKADFMKIIEQLKNAVSGAKENTATDTVPNKQEILDLVESVITPVANAIDEKIEALKPVENPEPDPAIEELRNEIKALKNSFAGKKMEPENEKTDRATALQSKIKVEYEN